MLFIVTRSPMQLIPALNHDFKKILSKPTTISGLKNKGYSNILTFLTGNFSITLEKASNASAQKLLVHFLKLVRKNTGHRKVV